MNGLATRDVTELFEFVKAHTERIQAGNVYCELAGGRDSVIVASLRPVTGQSDPGDAPKQFSGGKFGESSPEFSGIFAHSRDSGLVHSRPSAKSNLS